MQKRFLQDTLNETVQKNQTYRILNATRDKKIVTYKGTPIRLSEYCSAESQKRMEWYIYIVNKKFSQEYSIQQSYPSGIKEKWRLFQANES